MVLAAIPSPSRGVVHLGPVPLRAYALMIVIGIIVAVVVTARRLRARGVDPVVASEVAYWAVPFGIVGARIYHVVSSPEAYFGKDGDLVAVFEVWNGGLAIWGAVAGGALGAWIACRRMDVSFGLFADALAPGLALAQAIGRWGNWFNQELYGRATDLPWAVRIDPAHQMIPGVSTYHPTFLYESLWNLVVAGVLLLVDRRKRLGRGRLFFLYVALYTIGRLWIEALRIDTAEKVLGFRINIWVSIVVFLLAVLALALVRRPIDANVGWPPAPGVGDTPDAEAGAGADSEAGVEGGTDSAGKAETPGRTDPAGKGTGAGDTGATGKAGPEGRAAAAGATEATAPGGPGIDAGKGAATVSADHPGDRATEPAVAVPAPGGSAAAVAVPTAGAGAGVGADATAGNAPSGPDVAAGSAVPGSGTAGPAGTAGAGSAGRD
ncbi:prolipoprotein diacylglyceryl transferase [Frankia sp. CcI49]|uniref:prolipoprotein diacylglyceryl transferase n=1 Tax=Frankia sp. CcI49 TaxID=1745382 RepID=UPI0009754708|nr:prolipoprotein diacylglyceryl transferase [Frankia sp. CcI49]